MTNETQAVYSTIAASIMGRPGPLVVGINGAYTAGKTMFTSGLQSYLENLGQKTQVIHYDDFHNPFSSIQWAPSAEVEAFYNRAFDAEKLVREVLQPLKEQGHLDASIPCIDLGTGQFTNHIHFSIDENTIVLLEGVLLLRPPILDYLGYTIYLDISTEEMQKRAKERDVPRFGEWILDAFTTRYIPVHQRYVREWNPRKQANVVIDNGDYARPVLA